MQCKLAIRTSLLVLAGLVLAQPAAGEQLDVYTTRFQPAGIGSIITNTWTIGYAWERPTGASAANVAINVDSSAAAANAYTLALTASALNGCTAGALTTYASTTWQYVGRLELTLTGADDCTGTLVFTLTSGSNTFGVAAARVVIIGSDVRVTDDAGGWALTGIPSNLNVAVTGELDVHQDEACGRTVPCLSNANTTIAIGNASANTTVPNTLHIVNDSAESIWAEALHPMLWLAVMWFAVYRSDSAGPRYGIMFLFALIGFIAVMLGLLDWRIGALFGVALGILAVGLANKFGAKKPGQGDKPA